MTCPRCNAENPDRTRARMITDTIIEFYFECEGCHLQRVLGRTTKKIQKLEKRLDKLQTALNRSIDAGKTSNQLFGMVKRTERQIKRERMFAGM